VPDAGADLSLPTIYGQLRDRMLQLGAPLPRQHLTDGAGAICLTRNPAFRVPLRVGDFISVNADGGYTVTPRDFHSLMAAGNYDEAKELAELHRREALYEWAERLISEGREVEGETAHRAAIAEGADRSLVGLSDLLHKQGRLGEAERYYREAMAAGYVRVIKSLDKILLASGRGAEAEAFYRQFLAEGYTDLRAAYAELLARQGKVGAAERICRQALADRQDDGLYADPAYNLGVYFSQLGMRAEALRFFELAADAGDDESAQIIRRLGDQ